MSDIALQPSLAQQLALALGALPARNREPFVYSATINFDDAAAIGTSRQGQIILSADSDFVCTHIRIGARVDDTGRVLMLDDQDGTAEIGGWPDPGVLVQITESGQNRVLHDRAVDARLAYYGDGKLPVPKMFVATSTIGVELTVLKAAAAGTGFDVTVAFCGYKDYSRPSRR